MLIWTPQDLAKQGRALNADLMTQLLEFAGDKPVDRPMAAAFTILKIANSVKRTSARDEFLQLIQDGVTDREALKSLGIRRWSPAQRCLIAFAAVPGAAAMPDPDGLLAIQKAVHEAMKPSWATLMPDKIYALAREAEQGGGEFGPDLMAKLLPPFGKAVQKAYGAFSGVLIDGQPSPVHHRYLQAFQRTWAAAGGAHPLHINSGLQCFGEALLAERE